MKKVDTGRENDFKLNAEILLNLGKAEQQVISVKKPKYSDL